jgi:signal transduction histidine kinase
MRHWRGVLLFILYILSAKLGMKYLSLAPENLTVLWFPSGIALIAFLRYGFVSLPFIFISSFYSNWEGLAIASNGKSFIQLISVTSISAFADSVQPLIAGVIWKKYIRSKLTSVSDLFHLIFFVALIPSLVTILILGTNLNFFHFFGSFSKFEIFRTLAVILLGDLMGVFVVLPLYVYWKEFSFEGKKVVFGALVLAQFLFLIYIVPIFPYLYFFSFLILTMIGYFNRLRGVSFAIVQLYVVSILLTNAGQGPFVLPDVFNSYLFLISFLIPFSFLSIFLTILFVRLEDYQAELEKKVYEKTKLLRNQVFEKNIAIEALRISEKKLNDSNKTKDKFFSIIAHDLKSPLSNYNQVTKLIYENYDTYSDSEKRNILLKMLESSERLYGLLEYLLDWSRTQSQSMPFNPETLNVRNLTEDCFLELKDKVQLKRIQFEILGDVSLSIHADEAMMRTIFRNLISNAIKFTKEEGSILFKFSQKEDGIYIECSDTGTGIKSENLEKLFRIDAQLTSIGLEGERGTGLGLILCKEFVNIHGGEIWAESEYKVGTKIFIRLPR